MPDFLREKVSGKRNRFVDDEYNLDFTFITDRVMGMSFPAHGAAEKMYRNDIDTVAKYFDTRHKNQYKIYNMSNRSILEPKFKTGKVESYEWADHHSPAMVVLFKSCQSMFDFMKCDKNIVSVNCNAGKGRTGTSISCFMIFSGLANNFVESITFYGWKRFKTGRGVSQPSQQRYVQYFDLIFHRIIKSPSHKRINKIVVKTLPKNTSSKEIKPCIEIMDGKNFKMIYTDNPNYKGIDKEQRKQVQPEKFSMTTYKIGKDNEMVIEIRNDKKPQDGV